MLEVNSGAWPAPQSGTRDQVRVLLRNYVRQLAGNGHCSTGRWYFAFWTDPGEARHWLATPLGKNHYLSAHSGGWCRDRTCATRRSRRVSTALPCRSANHPYSQINRAGGGRQQEAHSLLPYWSAWVDLNHRSPASKAGRDGQAPLHAGVAGTEGGSRTHACGFGGRRASVTLLRWGTRQDSNLHPPDP